MEAWGVWQNLRSMVDTCKLLQSLFFRLHVAIQSMIYGPLISLLQLLTMEKDLENMLKKIPGLFKEREDDLKRRERALERVKASIEEAYPSIGQPGDVIELSVGGTPVSVLRRTLTQVQGSMLASRFSGRWDYSLETTKDGSFFIDQPIELFLPLINYLRALACETPLVSPPPSPKVDADIQRDFDRMVEYYGVSLGVYPVGIYRLDDANGQLTLVSSHPDYEVSSEDEFATFFVLPLEQRHAKYIKSFEVKVVDESTHAQVGWVSNNGYQYQLFSRAQDGTQGVGYGSYSIAFNTARSGMVLQGNLQAVPNSMMQSGSVIRCENKGESWYIDGKLIASTVLHDNVAQISTVSMSNPLPCVSIKGSFEITAIEFLF